MKLNLSEFSLEEIQAELEKRKQEKELNEKKERGERIKHLVKHRKVFLKFMPHDRGSCKSTNNNDFHPDHKTAYCNRCVLEGLEGDEEHILVSFDLRLEHV